MKLSWLSRKMKDAGFYQYGAVNTSDIVFSQEVRAMCEANACRQYGKTWACPPAVGSVEECRKRIQQYEKMLVFTGKYQLEDSFDYEGMMAGAKEFRCSCRAFDQELKARFRQFLLFSNEGCDLCPACTYPTQPCRFPDRVHGSLEGNGIFVNELAQLAGVRYNNGANTVTYFGALACRADDLARLEGGE